VAQELARDPQLVAKAHRTSLGSLSLFKNSLMDEEAFILKPWPEKIFMLRGGHTQEVL
jgi:hypothetical protein